VSKVSAESPRTPATGNGGTSFGTQKEEGAGESKSVLTAEEQEKRAI